jgi:hypothetical protein
LVDPSPVLASRPDLGGCWPSRLVATAAEKSMRGTIANAKIFGWAIYAIGFAIWVFGYFSAGYAPLFDWNAVAPWWISGFLPNLEAELGMGLMFVSMIPIYGRAIRGNLARLFTFAALLIFAAVTLTWWGFLAWFIWHVI